MIPSIYLRMHIIILDDIQVSEIVIGETQNSYIHIVRVINTQVQE